MSEYEEYYDEVRELSNYDLNRLLEKAGELPREKFRAILTELEKRGALDEKGRLSLLRLSSNTRNETASGNINGQLLRSPLSDPNITDDPGAPVLYSRYVIRFICILFSPLFAGILMAINFFRLQKKREMYLVAVVSLLFTALTSLFARKYEDNYTIIVLIFNLLYAIFLEEVFWNRFIGKEFKFRRQYIFPTLLIIISISLLLTIIGLSVG